MPLGLCVVGCGDFARTFAQAMRMLPGEVRLFFASRDAKRASEYAHAFNGAGSFGSYEEAAADPDVEAMYICTPHYLHRDHVAMAASAGKHILVEKPIARTPDEGRAIIDAAGAAGVTLMVAENYRFMAPARRAKALIDDGVIGHLRLIQLQEEALFSPGRWRNHRDLNGGGVFIDGGIHKVDLLRYLAGTPEHIYALELPRATPGLDAEDGLVMMTRSARGVVGVINHSWTNAQRAGPMWVSITGSQGRIYFEAGSSWLKHDDGRSERTITLGEDHYGLAPMVKEFVDSIREGRAPEMSGAEGLEDLALVLKAYESVEAGRSLPLG